MCAAGWGLQQMQVLGGKCSVGGFRHHLCTSRHDLWNIITCLHHRDAFMSSQTAQPGSPLTLPAHAVQHLPGMA